MNALGAGFAPAITPAIGNFMAEAGGVCLEHNRHPRGVRMSVAGDVHTNHELDWPLITDDARENAWLNLRVATEWGAAGIAALLANEEINYKVVKQSWTGTGFDYWLTDESDLLPGKARMEVSGILSGGNAEINDRVRRKTKQTKSSDDSGLPAYVVVVEFSLPAAHVEERMP